jgi:hypothetical protein
MIAPDECLAVTGEGEYLGDWDPKRALRLNDHNFPTWEINLPLDRLKVPFEYKFLVVNKDGEVL